MPEPSLTRSATTATSRSATGCSTSRSTCTPARGPPGSTTPSARRWTTSAPTRRSDRARAAAADHHGRPEDQVLPTAGAAEAFTLVARLRPWRRPVVVHPQFTEPHAALEQAGHAVTEVVLARPFLLDPAAVPDDADLVIVGNPTNPTGVLHPAATLARCSGPAGWSSSTRRSWTRARRARVAGRPTGTTGWSSSAASPRTGASPASAPATWSATRRRRRPRERSRRGRSPRPRPRPWWPARRPRLPTRPSIARSRSPTGANTSKPASTSSASHHLPVGCVLRAGAGRRRRPRPTQGSRHRRTPGRHLPGSRRRLGADRCPTPGNLGPTAAGLGGHALESDLRARGSRCESGTVALLRCRPCGPDKSDPNASQTPNPTTGTLNP